MPKHVICILLSTIFGSNGCSTPRRAELDALPVQPAKFDTEPHVRSVLDGSKLAILSLEFSPDGGALAAGGLDASARVWKTPFEDPPKELPAHIPNVFSLAFSPDGTLLATGSGVLGADTTIRVWRVSDGGYQYTLSGHRAPVDALAFAPDGRTLASASSGIRLGEEEPDISLRIWDINERRQVGEARGCSAPVSCLHYAPKGQRLFASCTDGTVWIFDTASYRVVEQFDAHEEAVTSFALSRDGTLLATASVDHTCRLWRMGQRGAPITLRGHAGPVRSVAIDRDCAIVATGSSDGTVALWRASDGKLLRILKHYAAVECVSFAQQGNHLLAASGVVGKVILWELDGLAP